MKKCFHFQLCQICRKDDNEAMLLLCDGCDKGYHTYCFKVKIIFDLNKVLQQRSTPQQ